MRRQVVIAFFIFILSLLSVGGQFIRERQFYDSEVSCLDTEYGCIDDGHDFKDTDIWEDEQEYLLPGYPNYYSPEVDPDYEYSEKGEDEITTNHKFPCSYSFIPSKV